jgi:hypothetical protein
VLAQASNSPEYAAQNATLRTKIKGDDTYELDFFNVNWHLVDRLPEAPESAQR